MLIFVASRNNTFFEISNHLGNVHLVLSDYRGVTGDGSGNITGYHSSVLSASEYYPLGMLLVEGEYNSQSYRYGFNTQERDDEIYGSGNSYSAEFWQYDARLGRRWNVDPVNKHCESSYACFYNNPIFFTDPKGDDPPEEAKRYTLQKGDNLTSIAEQHNISVDDLVAWNDKINDPDIIYAGDVIYVSDPRRWIIHAYNEDNNPIYRDSENPEERWIERDGGWIDLNLGFETFGDYFNYIMEQPDGYCFSVKLLQTPKEFNR